MASENVNVDGKSVTAERRIFTFHCTFKTDMPEDDEGELCVAEYRGELFVTLDDDLDDDEYPAGDAKLFIVNAEAAELHGESLLELLDQRAETAAYIPLIGKEAGNFSPAVCKKLGEEMVLSRNMLILDRLEIRPQFRGQELGLRYMRAAITRFGMGCRIAAMKPFPLQFEDKVSESTIADFRAATAKLKKYYARDGFESLRGSDLMILDLEKRYQADY